MKYCQRTAQGTDMKIVIGYRCVFVVDIFVFSSCLCRNAILVSPFTLLSLSLHPCHLSVVIVFFSPLPFTYCSCSTSSYCAYVVYVPIYPSPLSLYPVASLVLVSPSCLSSSLSPCPSLIIEYKSLFCCEQRHYYSARFPQSSSPNPSSPMSLPLHLSLVPPLVPSPSPCLLSQSLYPLSLSLSPLCFSISHVPPPCLFPLSSSYPCPVPSVPRQIPERWPWGTKQRHPYRYCCCWRERSFSHSLHSLQALYSLYSLAFRLSILSSLFLSLPSPLSILVFSPRFSPFFLLFPAVNSLIFLPSSQLLSLGV